MAGKEKLKDKMIDGLQNYYRIAIRSNASNLPAMKKAILVSLFHCASSNEDSGTYIIVQRVPIAGVGFSEIVQTTAEQIITDMVRGYLEIQLRSSSQFIVD